MTGLAVGIVNSDSRLGTPVWGCSTAVWIAEEWWKRPPRIRISIVQGASLTLTKGTLSIKKMHTHQDSGTLPAPRTATGTSGHSLSQLDPKAYQLTFQGRGRMTNSKGARIQPSLTSGGYSLWRDTLGGPVALFRDSIGAPKPHASPANCTNVFSPLAPDQTRGGPASWTVGPPGAVISSIIRSVVKSLLFRPPVVPTPRNERKTILPWPLRLHPAVHTCMHRVGSMARLLCSATLQLTARKGCGCISPGRGVTEPASPPGRKRAFMPVVDERLSMLS